MWIKKKTGELVNLDNYGELRQNSRLLNGTALEVWFLEAMAVGAGDEEEGKILFLFETESEVNACIKRISTALALNLKFYDDAMTYPLLRARVLN